jgi:hypothetical protein
MLSCAYVHPLYVKKNQKINFEKEKIYMSKVNLILSHANHTFFILDLQIEPQAFKHIHCVIRKCVFLMWKKVQLKIQFVSRLLVLRPLSKVALRTPNKSNLHSKTSHLQNKDAKRYQKHNSTTWIGLTQLG